MEITVTQYGKTFSKSNIQVEEEVIKKTKKFNWYFKYNNSVSQEDYEKLNKVKQQIRNQFDSNKRKLTFNINL